MNYAPPRLTKTLITGFDAFKLFCSLQSPKPEGSEFWFKLGHNWFFHGELSQTGEFTITRSLGSREKGRRDVNVSHNPLFINGPAQAVNLPAFKTFNLLSKKKDGGVFYLPDQPVGAPEKDRVTTSNDVRCEFDDGTTQEQWGRLEEFTRLTGLAPTFSLSSGGKSIHAHWKLDKFYPIADVVYLNRLVAVLMLSDEAVSHVPQPMRCPGFNRKGKGHQAIIQVSGDRYSFERVREALRTYAEAIGIRFPESITEEWWKGTPALIKKAGFYHQPNSLLIAKFNTGLEAWEEEQQAIAKARVEQKVRSEIKRKELGLTGTSLVDALNQTCDRLGADAFDNPSHDWKWSGNRARGCCLWHDSTSKSSAWITNSNNGAWLYHCNVCTDGRGINAFSYWLRENYGIEKYPRGKEWVEKAKEFLSLHGVQYEEPEFKPNRQKAKSEATGADEPSRKDRAYENWVPLLSTSGDDRPFFGDALANTVSDKLRKGDRALIIQSGVPGTGKTTAATKAAEIIKGRHESLIAPTPLETSARTLSEKLGIPYRKDNHSGDESFSCCTNSFIPDATNVDWARRSEKKGGVALWDEASETLGLISGFSKDARVKRNIGQDLASTRQINVAQSATIKQYDVEFYQNLGAHSDKEVVVDAIAKAAYPREISIYTQQRELIQRANDSEVRSTPDPKVDLYQKVRNLAPPAKEHGHAIVITSNSQQLNSRWGTMLLEFSLQDLGVPITRIDSQTSKDPSHRAHKLSKQGDITINAGEIFILSPSVETNTSIHCSKEVSRCSVINLDTGSMTVERLLQANRVRGREGLAIEQHIVISDYIGRLPHGDAFTPEEVLADIKRQASNNGAKHFHALLKGEAFEDQDWVVQDYCRRTADYACSMVAKDRILPEVLKAQGHSVSIVMVPQDKESCAARRAISNQLDEYRLSAIEEWNDSISKALIITQEEKEDFDRRGEYSLDEWYSIKRFKIERILGNRLERKVQDGEVIECNEGIELTPDYVDAVDRKRLATAWHRTFDAFQAPYDWFIKSARKMDGVAPSIMDSSNSAFARNMALETCGIGPFFRKNAIHETAQIAINYEGLLMMEKPSKGFQDVMVKKFKDRAFTSQTPELRAIAEYLSQNDELEKIAALLGIRDVERNKEGKATIGNVLTIIRRWYGVRTMRSQSVRVDGWKGATIITLDDRTHAAYSALLGADKIQDVEMRFQLGIDTYLDNASEGVHRSQLFTVWEESRKVSGALALDFVPLLQRVEALSLCNKGTQTQTPLNTWLSELGAKQDEDKPTFKVGQRVRRTDAEGWGGVVRAVRDAVVDVLFDLESAVRVIPMVNLAAL